MVEETVYNEECKVDVQHLCEEHISIPVVHEYAQHLYQPPPEPAYGPPEPLFNPPHTEYGPPEPLFNPPEPLLTPPNPPSPHYGPPEPVYGAPPQDVDNILDPVPNSGHVYNTAEKLSQHQPDLRPHYALPFTRVKRQSQADTMITVAGQGRGAEPPGVFPQLGAVLQVDEFLDLPPEIAINNSQEDQVKNIVKVSFNTYLHLETSINDSFTECDEKHHGRRPVPG